LQDEFSKQCEDYVNLNVLGKLWLNQNWHLSTTQNSNKEKMIADQGMPNTCVRHFMDAFDQLADICLWYDEERKEEWKKSMDTWQKLMDKKIFQIKKLMHLVFSVMLFKLWVDLAGLEGMTNYIHMIGSRYMAFYLQEWRNI
jgi:hypothetical protein